MMNFILVFGAVALLFVLIGVAANLFKRTIIFEYERGLKYVNGKFAGVLAPGRYAHTYRTIIEKLDVRLRTVVVGGQEVLSADGVNVKISLVAQFAIADANLAINHVARFQEALHIELQTALRRVVGALTIDGLLEQRQAIDAQLLELSAPRAAQFGLHLVAVNVRDLMLAGEFKKLFAQVVQARQEGLAALEKARGETAALRNLANAAKLLETNPALAHLRLLQAIGESSGSSIVLKMSPPASALPGHSQGTATPIE